MKAILMSIRPQHVANILNGLKTLEIRKRFPSDYVGWVYIYCTKNGHLTKCSNGIWYNSKHGKPYDSRFSYYSSYEGKVVARFWCDKVEKVHCNSYGLETSEHWYRTTDKNEKELLNECALTFDELDDYLCFGNGYAIHINNLEIFDKPKDISEFSSKIEKTCICFNQFVAEGTRKIPLTRAPQSWCYVEV